MEGVREKYIREAVAILNVFLLMKVLKDCLGISEYRYEVIALLILIGILIYSLFTRVLINKKRKAIFIIGVIAVIARALLRNSGELLFKLGVLLVDNYTVIIPAVLNGKEIAFKELLLTLAFIVPMITSIFLGITRKFIKIPTIFNTLLFLIFWYLIFYLKLIPNIKYLVALIIFTFGCEEYVKRCKDCRSREVKTGVKFYQITIVLLILTVVMTSIINILPQEYKGKSFEGIITVIKNNFASEEKEVNFAENAIKRSFNMKESGYSDSSVILGGPIRLNGRLTLTVEADRPYYLRGKVKDYYNGNSWSESKTELSESRIPYNNEGNGMTYLLDARNNFNYDTEKIINITHAPDFKTSTYFTPSGAIDVIREKQKLFMNNIPLFLTDNIIDTTYQVKVVSYGDYDNYLQGIENTNNREIFEQERYKTLSREFNITNEEYYVQLEELVNVKDSEELQSYNKFKWQYMNYLQVPNTIEEGVYLLVEKILINEAENTGREVKNLTADEKALAIMNYLRENYSYTINVERGKYEDFVSDFILNKNEGYCTYFASATVMMCRIAGIPARYAEGFNMNGENEINGKYKITNKDAHAWAEVLVNPYKDQWAVADSVPQEEEVEETPEIDKPVNVDNNNEQTTEPNRHNNTQSGMEDEFEGGSNQRGFTVKTGLLCISSIVLFILFMILFLFDLRERRILRSKSIIPLYKYYLLRLNAIGIRKAEYKGDKEFANSIRDIELKCRVMKIVNLVYEEYYGGRTVENIDRRDYIKFLENYIKNEVSKPEYYRKKYFPHK